MIVVLCLASPMHKVLNMIYTRQGSTVPPLPHHLLHVHIHTSCTHLLQTHLTDPLHAHLTSHTPVTHLPLTHTSCSNTPTHLTYIPHTSHTPHIDLSTHCIYTHTHQTHSTHIPFTHTHHTLDVRWMHWNFRPGLTAEEGKNEVLRGLIGPDPVLLRSGYLMSGIWSQDDRHVPV